MFCLVIILLIQVLFIYSYRSLVNFFFHFSAVLRNDAFSRPSVSHLKISEFSLAFKRLNSSKVNSPLSIYFRVRWCLTVSSVNRFSNPVMVSLVLPAVSSTIWFSDSSLWIKSEFYLSEFFIAVFDDCEKLIANHISGPPC